MGVSVIFLCICHVFAARVDTESMDFDENEVICVLSGEQKHDASYNTDAVTKTKYEKREMPQTA